MVFLDYAATSFHKPPSVRRAVLDALHSCASPGRGGYAAAQAAETLLDVDFSTASKHVEGSRVGFFQGVLPEGVGDNFSSWSEGRYTTSLQEEDGVKFLRFASDPGKGAVQFAVYCPKVTLPGFFRLTVKGRVRGNPLGLGLRLNPAPYTSFSQHQFGPPDWSEQESFHCVILSGS